jgi:Ras-related protein Rab-7A
MVFIPILSQATPSDPRTFPFILLGNKIDIDGGNSRVVRMYNLNGKFIFLYSLPCPWSHIYAVQVSEKKAKDWCASKGNIPYFETSAKEDYNVDPAFLSIAKIALANEHEQDM